MTTAVYSADTAVTTTPTYVNGITLTAGSDTATVTIRNAAAGTVYLVLSAVTGTTFQWMGTLAVPGLYVDVSGTAMFASVDYDRTGA